MHGGFFMPYFCWGIYSCWFRRNKLVYSCAWMKPCYKNLRSVLGNPKIFGAFYFLLRSDRLVWLTYLFCLVHWSINPYGPLKN